MAKKERRKVVNIKKDKKVVYSLITFVTSLILMIFLILLEFKSNTLINVVFIVLIVIFAVSYIFFWISILIHQFKKKDYIWFVVTLLISPISIFYYSIESDIE